MKRKWLSSILLIAALLVLMALTLISCRTVDTKGLEYELFLDNYYVLKNIGTATDKNIVIPSQYNGLPVTAIDMDAFKDCESITSVTVPESITLISSYAFRDCKKLRTVYWNAVDCKNSYSSNPVFYGCDNLDKVIIGKRVKSIPCSLFKGCAITDISLSESVTSIGDGAFSCCEKLASFKIPEGVTQIGSEAFSGCKMLVKINIPANVKTISDKAFYNCESLTDIVIPEGVTEIGGYAFAQSGITEITVPEAISLIDSGAFSKCNNLKTVHWNAGDCNLLGSSSSYSVFSDCNALSSVILGDKVEAIPDYAFSNCQNLSKVILSDSLKSIGVGAFFFCESLTEITIPQNCISIGDYAYTGCLGVEKVFFPECIEEIGDRAFSGCRLLTNIEFGGSIEQWNSVSIGSNWANNAPAAKVICADGEVEL